MPPADRLFLAEWKVISEIAAKGSCVIVGRCADVILRHRPHTIRLFIHAPEGFRRQRAVTSYGLAEGEAAEKVRTINEERARHYKNTQAAAGAVRKTIIYLWTDPFAAWKTVQNCW